MFIFNIDKCLHCLWDWFASNRYPHEHSFRMVVSFLFSMLFIYLLFLFWNVVNGFVQFFIYFCFIFFFLWKMSVYFSCCGLSDLFVFSSCYITLTARQQNGQQLWQYNFQCKIYCRRSHKYSFVLKLKTFCEIRARTRFPSIFKWKYKTEINEMFDTMNIQTHKCRTYSNEKKRAMSDEKTTKYKEIRLKYLKSLWCCFSTIGIRIEFDLIFSSPTPLPSLFLCVVCPFVLSWIDPLRIFQRENFSRRHLFTYIHCTFFSIYCERHTPRKKNCLPLFKALLFAASNCQFKIEEINFVNFLRFFYYITVQSIELETIAMLNCSAFVSVARLHEYMHVSALRN